MPQATLAECIIDLKDLITTLDTQQQSHSIAQAILELMLRTDALYIPKHKLYSLFLGLNEQVVDASRLGESALDAAIKTTRGLIAIAAGGSEVTKH